MSAALLTTDLDVLVPEVAWHTVVEAALQAPAYRVLVSGGLIFTLHLVVRAARALWALQHGEQPQWFKPLVMVVGYMLVLSHYESLVIGTLRIVTHLGAMDAGMGEIDAMFRARNDALAASFLQHQPDSSWTLLTPDGLSVVLLRVTAQLLQTLAHAVCIALRCLQIILLAVLVQTGPVLIGCSLLGGPLAQLGIAWWLTLVEVAAWSWVQDVALQVFVLLASALPEHLGLVHEMTLSIVFMTALVAVPAISSMLLRGHGAAGVGQALGAQAAAWTLARGQALGRTGPTWAVGSAKNIISAARARRAERALR